MSEKILLVDDEKLDDALEQTRSMLKAQKAEQLLTAIINELRRETVITIDTELMEQYRPQG